MRKYIFRRLLLMVPTLLLVSLLAFMLQEAAPGDPVKQYLKDAGPDQQESRLDQRIREATYRRAVTELGADLPPFYFAIQAASLPDTLHRILPLPVRKVFTTWCRQTGNPGAVQGWYDQIHALRDTLSRDASLSEAQAGHLRRIAAQLPLQEDKAAALRLLEAWPDSIYPQLRMDSKASLAAVDKTSTWRNWVPMLVWHGTPNRYHRWMSGLFSTESQRSWVDGQPIWRKIGQAARWTLIMNGLAILLAYGISIPLGVWLAGKAGSRSDQWVTFLIYALYAIPGFWLGTLLLIFFTTPTYGMDLFPSIGLGDIPPGAGFWETFSIRASHLFLPIFCLTYGSVAYLTRQMRNAMVQELKKDYIRTAWSKGLSQHRVLWVHAFRNALFPMITLFAQILPAALAGSVAIEVIFNIPGMGRLTYASILSQDWPLVYGILFLAAILTLVGSLLADLLYRAADPRVRLGN